jgi:ATP-dependent helicase YprA (DUF1998 family)
MRGASLPELPGSRAAPLLSQGQRDAALQAVLEDLASGGRADLSSGTALLPADGDIVTAWRRLPAEAAQFADFSDGIDARLQAALAAGGITHQADGMRHVLAGRHVVTITSTASGKTLCYNAPVLSGILRDHSTRALYLFPTKALAQDQLAELLTLTARLEEHVSIGAHTYDGDTPQDARCEGARTWC